MNTTLLKTSNTILIPVFANEDISLQLSRRSETSAVFTVPALFTLIFDLLMIKTFRMELELLLTSPGLEQLFQDKFNMKTFLGL